MKKLVVADAARRDLEGISRYTEEQWGAMQKQRYMNALSDGFTRLQEGSIPGRVRNDIRPGFCSIAIGRHVIFYRESQDAIEVVRVLHDRMDMHRHLPDEPAQDDAVPSPPEPED